MLGRPRHEFSPLLIAPFCAAALCAAVFAAPAGAATSGSVLAGGLAKLGTAAVAAKPLDAQAEAIGLPAEGAGSLVREGENVVVEAHFEAGAVARVEALRAAGATVLLASRRYQTVALSVEPEDLEAIAAVPGVSAVEPSLEPIVYAVEGEAEADGPTAAAGGGGTACEGGSVISQGVAQLKVAGAREAFSASGAGVTVGVLSNSFDRSTEAAHDAAEDEGSDDLPGPNNDCEGQQTPVDVIEEGPNKSEMDDEGRAMLQVVHDVAPEAELAFATAWSTELQFARNIERLAEPVVDGGAGASVIVDDVAYASEPFFQEGPVANAVRRVTEAGVTYLTAAGNNNLIETSSEGGTTRKHNIASWERSSFRNAACPSVLNSRVGEAKSDCLNFSPTGTDTTLGITVEARATLTVDLQWAEPWYGVHSDLNAYLLNASSEAVLKSGGYKNVGSGSISEPFEYLTYVNSSGSVREVQLVIDRCIHNCNSAASVTALPRLKVAFLENGSGVSKLEYPESDAEAGIRVGPTVFGHAASPDAITVGAVYYEESSSAPREPEVYSSRGPASNYFGPVDGTTAAAAIEPGEAIAKPNVTATDCASTTFFAELVHGKYRFCGTSEAAPHAAGVAALMKQIEPLASPRGIREAIEESATPFTSVTSCEAVGAGLLNAEGALAALEAGPSTGTGCTAELDPEGEVGEEETGGGSTGGSGSGGSGKEEEKTTPTPTPTPAPVVTITKGPGSLTDETRPVFEFSADEAASYTCRVDGGAAQACSSPYVVPNVLGDGAHGFVVTATNAQGGSGSSGAYDFTVDTKAPVTKIAGHPKKVVKTRKASVVARFKLKASESSVTFYCQLDREPMRVCGANVHYSLAPGVHTLKVRAQDAAGNLATKWTVYRFRVKELPPARSPR